MMCIVCGALGGADIIQNVVLFLPLGIGLGMIRASLPFSLMVVITTTTGVELVQATVLTGRFASLGDILANTAGGMLGIWLGRRDEWWHSPPPAAQRKLVLGSLAAALLLLVAATAAIRPAVTPPPLTIQVAPVEPHGERFMGSVLSMALGDQVVMTGRLHAAADSAIRSGGTTLSFRMVSGPKAEFESSIIAIVDRSNRRVVRVSQDEANAVLEVQVAGSAVRVRSPRVVLRNALPQAAGDTVRIDAELSSWRLGLTVSTADARMDRRLTLRASTAWIPLYPFAYNKDAGVTRVSLLWLAALLVPTGYWSGSGRVTERDSPASVRSRRHTISVLLLVAVFAILGLGVFPMAFGFPVSPAIHWLAPFAGVAIGAAAGRVARPH